MFDVGEDGKLSGGSGVRRLHGRPLRRLALRHEGRLWAATDDGVHCFDTDGTLIGKMMIPEICFNVVFGGPKRNMLYVTATNSLYGVLTHVNGAKTF